MTITSATPRRLPTEPAPRASIAAKTLRTDRWWLGPLGLAVLLGVFIVYTLIRIFMNKWYWVPELHYLTPVYSPCLSDSCEAGASHLGTPLPKFPVALPLAILIFPILAGFRTTCYYYRKAGYRSLWASPQACAVAEPHKKYSGETRFPLILMNFHRYFFVLASILLLVNVYDAGYAFVGKNGGFGVGLGSLIIATNVVMLSLYTLSCHSCRHIVGGRLKHFSKHPVRYRFWNLVSKLNAKHGRFAMISLCTVIITDAYIMSLSAGWISDLRIFN